MKAWLALLLGFLLAYVCGAIETSAQSQQPSSPSTAESANSGLPLSFARSTGDLDSMVKAQNIRALVLYSHSSFFYVNGRPEGVFFEALHGSSNSLSNEKLRTGRQHVQVTFIPVRPDQLETYLTEGIGDMIAYPIKPSLPSAHSGRVHDHRFKRT